MEEERESDIWGDYRDSYNTNNYLLNLGVGIQVFVIFNCLYMFLYSPSYI